MSRKNQFLPIWANGVQGMELAEGQPIQEEGQQLIGKAVREHGRIIVAVHLSVRKENAYSVQSLKKAFN